MSQVIFAGELLDLNVAGSDSADLVFIEDSSYEFVSGGDAVNGY